jgi:hypothetical protein
MLAQSPATTAELTEQLDVDEGPLEILMQVLRWSEVLVCRNGRWCLAPPYDVQLVESSGRSLLPMLCLENAAASKHLNAVGVVAAMRGWRASTEVDDEHLDSFAEAMLFASRSAAPYIARQPELKGVRRLADLRAGSGGYAVWLCRMHPELHVTLLDRPEMLSYASKSVAEMGVHDQVELTSWNLHHDMVPDHDAALMSLVLHLMSPAQRLGLLWRVAAALPKGGLLLVHDFLYDAPEPLGPLAASAVSWLAMGSAYAMTTESMTAMLAEGGFTLDRVVPMPLAGTHLMVARKA